jgi:hypothetical protein
MFRLAPQLSKRCPPCAGSPFLILDSSNAGIPTFSLIHETPFDEVDTDIIWQATTLVLQPQIENG